jgi:hypothetical protein
VRLDLQGLALSRSSLVIAGSASISVQPRVYDSLKMEPNEILKKAWEAVQASGVPESMHEAAFREAVAIVRGEGAESAQELPPDRPATRAPNHIAKKSGPKAAAKRTRSEPANTSIQVPDAATFFAELAHESGVDETDLRDILKLGADGTINVTPPTRMLGGSKAEQARTIVGLVAPARLIGLHEDPVSAEALRRECQRKNCFDTNNFASTVIGGLDGVNYGGSRAEIVLTSKWVSGFQVAANRAHGRSGESDRTE